MLQLLSQTVPKDLGNLYSLAVRLTPLIYTWQHHNILNCAFWLVQISGYRIAGGCVSEVKGTEVDINPHHNRLRRILFLPNWRVPLPQALVALAAHRRAAPRHAQWTAAHSICPQYFFFYRVFSQYQSLPNVIIEGVIVILRADFLESDFNTHGHQWLIISNSSLQLTIE